MALITCQNVTMGYEGKIILEGVNFEVNSGDYLCILGENGSGKSTLMKGLLKLKIPTKGSILVEEGLLPKEIGYLPQQAQMQKNFPASVYEVVLSGRLNQLKWKPFYSSEDKKDVMDKLQMIGMEHLKNHCFQELSGGQQQRVLLARALCATRKLLLLDEPATGLDPLVTNELYRTIKNINESYQITIIMISHDIHAAVHYASHILHLNNRQMFFGNTELYKVSEFGQRFLGGMKHV
jgi:zinc transport system ATP-binding protein